MDEFAAKPRKCLVCPTILSSYNTEDVCALCRKLYGEPKYWKYLPEHPLGEKGKDFVLEKPKPKRKKRCVS